MTDTNIQVNRRPVFLVSAILITVLWALLVYEALYSAAVIWIGNEIFNHCALVIPASIYLIWERRKEIDWASASSSNLALFFLFGQLLLFLLGVAGDIQLFQHVAIFAMLPTLFWCFVGNKVAWQLKFPLLFVLFAVPVGEELVPFLQEITADISVYMLQLSGIPLFRSGLFIEIPQGKFLVAEACSGVSFLIASIVIGNLYAYMNLKTMRRRVFFVLLSVAVPILANAVRVYGIILVGYWSDMEHAVGADHLIYGWFFFAFVIVLLLAIGEWIRSRENKSLKAKAAGQTDDANSQEDAASYESESSAVSAFPEVSKATIGVLAVLVVLSLYQAYRMSNLAPAVNVYPTFALNATEPDNVLPSLEWTPIFNRSTVQSKQTYQVNGENFDVFYANFDGSGEGELVSSLHRLYQQDRWTLTQRERTLVNGKPMLLDNVTSSIGIKRSIYYFYVVDGKWMTSRQTAKLQKVIQTLQGQQSQGAIVAVSFIEYDNQKVDPMPALELVEAYISESFLGN
ncbi:exosortase A [Glaciecola sp. SC05]|uniref:exosortase A n=1 Tax=Glaciecola sp. SC05 TaxID=1987355 RepID=UPI0035274D26